MRIRKWCKGNGRILLSRYFHHHCCFGFWSRHDDGVDIETKAGKTTNLAREQGEEKRAAAEEWWGGGKGGGGYFFKYWH